MRINSNAISLRPQYELWAWVQHGEDRSERRQLRAPLTFSGRFWTRKGAKKWAEDIAGCLPILVESLEVLLATGRTAEVQYEIIRCPNRRTSCPAPRPSSEPPLV